MTKPSTLELANPNFKPPKQLPEDTQQVCIDLPGETIRCVVYKPKLEILLKKHRDVIFDISLFKGMTYTVTATHSDFYNARDKKIVLHKKKQNVTFTDGERMHLWVSRDFKGELLLSANGKVLGRYTPSLLDPVDYGSDPARKPAPLLVIMNNQPAQSTIPSMSPIGQCTPDDPMGKGIASLRSSDDLTLISAKHISSSSQHNADEHQTMHVVEVTSHNDTPEAIADFFKSGGESTAIDSSEILTRNWLLSQIVGFGAFYSDNKAWIHELWKEKFYLQKNVHKNAGTRWYIIFKGFPGSRKIFTAARYGTTNAKVLTITAGAGSAQGLRHAAWDAAKGSLKKASGLAVIFTISLDTAEWLSDYEQRDLATGKPKKDFFDLFYKIGIDLVKAGLGAAIGSLILGAFVFAGIITGGVGLIIGAIVFSIGAGYLIDLADKSTGATDKFNVLLRKNAKYLEDKLKNDYSGYEDSLNGVALAP